MLSENECTRAIIVNSEQPQDFIKTVSPCVGDPRPSGSREALPEVAEEADTCSSWIVTRDVFSSYFSAGGSACKISALWLLCIFAQVLASSVDYWIMLWYCGNNNTKNINNTNIAILPMAVCIFFFFLFQGRSGSTLFLWNIRRRILRYVMVVDFSTIVYCSFRCANIFYDSSYSDQVRRICIGLYASVYKLAQ